jgi:hypothetical protein
MSQPDPLVSARALLRDVTVRAAGLFGVQDRRLAVALLGEVRVAGIVGALVADPSPVSNPASRSGRAAAAIEAMRPWVAVPLLVAVSEGAVHLCDWDERAGAVREVARIPLADTIAVVERYRSARRVTITDRRSGYQLPLTATVSPLSATGAGARDVLAWLPQSGPTFPPAIQG